MKKESKDKHDALSAKLRAIELLQESSAAKGYKHAWRGLSRRLERAERASRLLRVFRKDQEQVLKGMHAQISALGRERADADSQAHRMRLKHAALSRVARATIWHLRVMDWHRMTTLIVGHSLPKPPEHQAPPRAVYNWERLVCGQLISFRERTRALLTERRLIGRYRCLQRDHRILQHRVREQENVAYAQKKIKESTPTRSDEESGTHVQTRATDLSDRVK
jgi:hypothetical protein